VVDFDAAIVAEPTDTLALALRGMAKACLGDAQVPARPLFRLKELMPSSPGGWEISYNFFRDILVFHWIYFC